MKQKTLLFTAFALMLYVSLTSKITGPAAAGEGNKTGGPGSSNQTCNTTGCHTSGIGTTTGSFEIRKRFQPDSNMIVNSYVPDSMYTVKFTGSHPVNTKFGFQLMAVKINDSSNAGTFSNLPAKVHTTVVAGRTLMEHSDTLLKTGSNYEVTFTWKAPSSGSGQVRFYGVFNAVNGDGTPGGDQPSASIMLALAEALSVEDPGNAITFDAYPNPVVNTMNLRLKNVMGGTYNIAVFDSYGRRISTQEIKIPTGTASIPMHTANWSSGLHYVQLSRDGNQKVIPVIKQ